MNNKKGEMQGGIGMLIMVAITLIVGLILLSDGIAGNVAQVSTTTTASNVTYTLPAAAGDSIDLTGQEYISGIRVYNETGATQILIPATNYTIGETVSETTGVKTVSLTLNEVDYQGISVNVTYVYGVEGYADSSGARAIAPIIVIFTALALAVVAIYPALRQKWD